MELLELLDRLARDPDCVVLSPAGQPRIDASHTLPEDVRAFYDICGGLTIGRDTGCEIRIVGPVECVSANMVILGKDILEEIAALEPDELAKDPAWDWYIIVDDLSGNHISIDFGQRHTGRCYDVYWDTFMSSAHDATLAIADSFTQLLERLYEHKGKHWHWDW